MWREEPDQFRARAAFANGGDSPTSIGRQRFRQSSTHQTLGATEITEAFQQRREKNPLGGIELRVPANPQAVVGVHVDEGVEHLRLRFLRARDHGHVVSRVGGAGVGQPKMRCWRRGEFFDEPLEHGLIVPVFPMPRGDQRPTQPPRAGWCGSRTAGRDATDGRRRGTQRGGCAPRERGSGHDGAPGVRRKRGKAGWVTSKAVGDGGCRKDDEAANSRRPGFGRVRRVAAMFDVGIFLLRRRAGRDTKLFVRRARARAG